MLSWKPRSLIAGIEVARLNEVNFLRAVAPRQPRAMSAMRLPVAQPLQMTLFPRDEENLIATVVSYRVTSRINFGEMPAAPPANGYTAQ